MKKRQYSWPLNGGSCNIPKSLHHFLYPGEKDMDFGEDMRILGIITVTFIGKGCDTLKLAVAHKWSTGITLRKRQRKDWIWEVCKQKKNYILFFKNKGKQFFPCLHLYWCNWFYYLANPSFLFVKLGAQHVTGVEVLFPYLFALKAELHLLRGLPQNIWGGLVDPSSAPASDRTVDVGWDFPIFPW